MDAKAPEIHTIEEFYETSVNERIELIHGVFYNMAPPNRLHQRILSILHTRIFNYIENKGGDCEVYPAPFGVQLSEEDDTVVEPDISVICDPKKLTDRGCTGAPDWIIEIVSPGNPSHDYLTKKSLYMTSGVREYWIIDPAGLKIGVYTSNEPDRPAVYDFTDTVRVGIYEDLEIDFSKIKL